MTREQFPAVPREGSGMSYKLTSAGLVAVTVVGAVIAGCSGSSSGAHSGSGSTAPVQADPAPTESNPPGDIPDNQVFVTHHPTSGFTGFTVKVPEGWARTDKGATTVFTDKLNSITIATANASGAPTVTSVKNTVVPRLSATVPKFASPKVSQVTRKAGPVVLLTYQGDSAKDPVTGKVVRNAYERYAFHRQGHEVDLTLSGPVNADNVDPWRIVSDSFAWR
ncbi:hypothetical protein ACF1AO_20135 [Streptomyces longwoodensis]|uniref:hypothetical protein n=1 Tax=Streptomyces longwoodensis TaxID=68231 RepID=UPI0037024339